MKVEKELSEMSLNELWELFPIFLIEHNDKWDAFYSEMEAKLRCVLPQHSIKRISHIGSTAVPGIWAKDIVDVLVEISTDSNIECIAQLIERSGLLRMSMEDRRISLNSGYTKNGFADKVFHIHLRYVGDNDELYFRDYLKDHPQIAKEYETLKLGLWKQFEHNRDAYTEAKTKFIRKWTAIAKSDYAGRY